MKYAIVNIAGKQYKVEEGQELLVDRLSSQGIAPSADKMATKAIFDEVLLVVDGDKTTIGAPHVAGSKVEVEVLGEEKGEKIRVVKYKSKSRYRKTRGFRALHSKVKITKITG